MVEVSSFVSAQIRNTEAPHSVEAEQAILGALLVDGAVWDEISDLLSAEDFYVSAHRTIFKEMQKIAASGSDVEAVGVLDALIGSNLSDRVGGPQYLHELSLQGSPRNACQYANVVRANAARRELIKAALNIKSLAMKPEGRSTDELITASENAISTISKHRITGDGPQDVSFLVAKAIENLSSRSSSGNALAGLGTGFQDLDRLTAGFQQSDLIILAARPSMGKTALATNFALHACLEEKPGPVIFFSMEQPREQMAQRILASLSGVNLASMRTGHGLHDHHWNRLNSAVGLVNDIPFYIDDQSVLTTNIMRTRIRHIQRKIGAVGLVVVDYIQLMHPGESRSYRENRNLELTDISRSLKLLAKDQNVPIVALSQLNREPEKRKDRRPILSDLRESGAIEQDADMIMFIYREEQYDSDTSKTGEAELLLAKNRNGPTGKIKLVFDKKTTNFRSYASEDEIPPEVRSRSSPL